jgi:secreted Zn-dependent insulinase-like peptidase
MLAQFFIAPKFDQSCLDREMNAVNSEFEMRLNNDSLRLYQLKKHNLKGDHPYKMFFCGDLDHLKSDTIREEVMAFWNEHYSANLMNLVVYSDEKLETLEEWVKESFSAVVNKNKVKKQITNPYTKDELSKMFYMVPVKDEDYLIITFYLEC